MVWSALQTRVLSKDKSITEGWLGVDIGRETMSLYKAEIAKAKTILWNGPMGVFEVPEFCGWHEAVG
jgi:phosphoglycerate kinase